jgi:hypothetical protein
MVKVLSKILQLYLLLQKLYSWVSTPELKVASEILIFGIFGWTPWIMDLSNAKLVPIQDATMRR